MTSPDGICVVTQPVSSASENHVVSLLDVLGAIAAVSLVAPNVCDESPLRDEYEVVDVADVGTGSSIPVAAFRFLRNQIRMARALRRRDESVVLFFGATSYLLPILAAKLAGKTVVVEPRGDVPLSLRLRWQQHVPEPIAWALSGIVAGLERVAYYLADGIVTYTPSMAEELELDRYEQKLFPHGARYVDTDRFSPQTSWADRPAVVGYLGRLDEEKGVRELADVVEELQSDVTFRFVGDGDLREWLETAIEPSLRSGSAEIVGWVDHDEVPLQLSDLRLLVLPSEPTEGLPTVILEAIACGTPVCAVPVSGVPDVVREGETGFLLDSREPAEIARTVDWVLREEDLEPYSRRCRELAEREYGFEAAVDRYRRILGELAG